jgi:hypothetical protein
MAKTPIAGLPDLLAPGFRAVAAGLGRKARGPRRYPGTARDICEQVTRACWDSRRRVFVTSPTTYPQFWARDFGRAAPALLELGFDSEVGSTYRTALACYEEAGRFGLVVSPSGRVWDFPAYAPDGFALFLTGLAQLGDRALVRRHGAFLAREARRFFDLVVEPATGLVRTGRRFSEAQDYAVRSSSCYSNVMCHLTREALADLGLPNPLAPYDYPTAVRNAFLDGDRFFDDATRPEYPSGDAAILPFWSGLMGHDPQAAELFARVLARMDRDGLNRPYPSRYGAGASPGRKMILLDRVNPWQRDAVWTCLGLHLLETERRLAPARFVADLARFRELVERTRCFPEVLDPGTGDLFRSPCYMSDDSMLWAVNLWALLRHGEPPAASG